MGFFMRVLSTHLFSLCLSILQGTQEWHLIGIVSWRQAYQKFRDEKTDYGV